MSETLYSYEDPESGEIFEAIIKSAEPIVRCKDCKYWDYEVDNDVGFCARTEDSDWNADDFCSRGEKKDEDSCRDE